MPRTTVDDLDIATTFGTLTGDLDDKLARCPWQPGPDGVPLLDRCPNRVIARRVALFDTTSRSGPQHLDRTADPRGGCEPLIGLCGGAAALHLCTSQDAPPRLYSSV